MGKKIGLLLIVLTLVFSSAFYSVYFQESEILSEIPETENMPELENSNLENENSVTQENPVTTDPVNNDGFSGGFETTGGEGQNSEPVIIEEPTATPVIEEPTAEPVVEEPTVEPQQPIWEGLNEDQVWLLNSLYNEMTPTGQAYSGWFWAENYAPCTWTGISCDGEGHVSGLTFENAGFFTVFPSTILNFRELKELHMVDTLVRGPLPETLFADLPKLEKLELSGNYFTGTIPAVPENFEVYPVLEQIIICDNREDDRKSQLILNLAYTDVMNFTPDPYTYPDIDLTPGLDGEIPLDWNRLQLLSEINLSGNFLTGEVPQTFGQLPLRSLDLRENESLTISQELYDYLRSFGNSDIVLDGLTLPVVPETGPEPTEEPVSVETMPENQGQPNGDQDGQSQLFMVQPNPNENQQEQSSQEPTAIPSLENPTEIPVVNVPSEVPTEIPQVIIPTEIPTEVPPTAVPVIPTEAPTQVPPTPQTIYIVVTATPVPQYYTATPAYYYPIQQPYYYPTATPYTYQYQYQQPYYTYPTATPYTSYNPNWVYPTATSAYSYPQYVQLQPTQVPTLVPTQDQAALLGFTYKLEAMTENNIPMTWRYTGMTDYSINYLDASGNIYPGFAMEWTPAAELCNASACNTSVSVPEELLKQGKFSLQLRTRDAAGKTYVSDPVEMEVSSAQTAPTPEPEPEQPKSFFAGFFEWLFGPLIRLFGGKK